MFFGARDFEKKYHEFDGPSTKKKFWNTRKIWIATGIITAFSIIVIVAVTTIFVLKNSRGNGRINDSKTTTAVTTEENPNATSDDGKDQTSDVPTTIGSTASTGSTASQTTTITDPPEWTTITYPETPSYFQTRDVWGAEEPKSNNIPRLDLPIKRIIIGHTGGSACSNENDCIAAVKSLQFHHASLVDIPYNFLIGGDGNVYEGRGFHVQGQHTQNLDATEYNSIGICIAFIGNYENSAPNEDQLDLLDNFIDTFVRLGFITEDYLVVSQDDLMYPVTKATALNDKVKSLKHFRSLYKIYRREEWNAQSSRSQTRSRFNRVMDWVLIGHTVTPLCDDLASCMARARSLQTQAFGLQYGDIHYNIMFGGNGYALEGRGWDLVGAHAIGFNSISIGVGTIGDFNTVPPNDAILNAMLQVYDDAMALGKLTDDYKIFGRADFGGPGPGVAFMNTIRGWCRYGNGTKVCSTPTTATTTTSTTTEGITGTVPMILYPEYVSTRTDWEAEPPRSNQISRLNIPIKRIIIGHTGGDSCANEGQCKGFVKSLQFPNSTYLDIPYNFLIGGDEKIYEGRGFYFEGQHTRNLDATEYDSIGICIAFIGNYEAEAPSTIQMELLKDFMQNFIDEGLISDDYVIVLQDDLKYTQIRATALNEEVETLENFYSLQKIYRRNEWNAQRSREDVRRFSNTINWVVIGHTGRQPCVDQNSCIMSARSFQISSFNQEFDDIEYNILLGGDGLVFEGRGFDKIGDGVVGLNEKSIGVGIIGNFSSVPPNDKIITSMEQVFKDAVILGKLSEDYKVFGRSDFGGDGPGNAFMDIIKEWCRYGNGTKTC